MIDDLGLLPRALAVGLGYAAHGTQKAFGWFDGPGPQGAAGFMESLGSIPEGSMPRSPRTAKSGRVWGSRWAWAARSDRRSCWRE